MSFDPPIPFFCQEHEWSCTPACLRMVLTHLGTIADEASLCGCCKTTETGTYATDAVACARQYGFEAELLRHQQLDDLRRWLADEVYPIVFVNLFPLIARWVLHTVVVVEIDETDVHYLDPARGKCADNMVSFEQAWHMNQRRVLVIYPGV